MRVGMELPDGGRDFAVSREIAKRLGKHLWLVRCRDYRGSYSFVMTTTEIQGIIDRFGR